MMNFQWKVKASCTFFDGIHIPRTMKIAILHVKNIDFDCKNERFFVTFLAPSVYRGSSKVVIFQGEHDDDFAWKMHHFWLILMPSHIPRTCFLCFSHFGTLHLYEPPFSPINRPWDPYRSMELNFLFKVHQSRAS